MRLTIHEDFSARFPVQQQPGHVTVVMVDTDENGIPIGSGEMFTFDKDSALKFTKAMSQQALGIEITGEMPKEPT